MGLRGDMGTIMHEGSETVLESHANEKSVRLTDIEVVHHTMP
jgi:hypothetical protein